MTTRRRAHRPTERGVSLIEAMIALSILLVGLLGMAQLQIYGMSSTQGARAQTIATQLATELASALSRQPLQAASGAENPLLTGIAGPDDDTPPTDFGRLLPLGIPTTNVHTWSDSTPVPGARLDASLERDPEDVSQPIYHRRWTVWNVATTSNGIPAKLIAVSVIFRERTVAKPHEVVVLASSEVRGAFMANVIGLK